MWRSTVRRATSWSTAESLLHPRLLMICSCSQARKLASSHGGLQALLELVQVFYGYIGGQVVPHKSYWFTTASDVDLASMPQR